MSSPLGSAAWDETLPGVLFVNPNAAQARSRRRNKLAASRARIAAAPSTGGGSPGSADGGASGNCGNEVRKQQRMLRNRESAALSRKRKSDRIGELEIQVESLEEENRRLRRRITQFGDGGGGAGAACCPPTATKRPRTTSTAVPPRSAATATPFFIPNILPTVVSPATPSATSSTAAASFNIVSRPAVFA